MTRAHDVGWPGLALLAVGLTLLGGSAGHGDRAWAAPALAPAPAVKPLPDLRATDQFGRTASIGGFKGRWVVVFFGYTRCPDVCPTGLSNLALVLRDLGPSSDLVQPVFVTVDPSRDTPAVLADYLKDFDPRLVGLRYKAADLRILAQAFGAMYTPSDPAGAAGHTNLFHLVTPGGSLDRNPLLSPLSVEYLRGRMDALAGNSQDWRKDGGSPPVNSE